MIKQLPAERPLPQKQEILERVLSDDGERAGTGAGGGRGGHRTWLVPVAAAASIAVIAGGLLTIPALVSSDDNGTSPADQTSPTTQNTPRTSESAISIDRGKLTAAEATAFGTECVKSVGATVDQILHATKIVGRTAGSSTDWTVAVKSGGSTYACVGRISQKGSDGRLTGAYDFGTFSTKHPDGLGGSGDGSGLISKIDGTGTAKLTTYRWIVAPATATKVQRRILVNGKPGAWFSSDVVDGLGYVRASVEARLVSGNKVRIETRLLDDAGNQVGNLLVQGMSVVPQVGGSGGITLQSDDFPR
ncbi:MAG TPA: hypothetical protein VFG33_31645 [Kribbella sp.]|uniref:hypothetical protein n=1 Tax=Kribbella sp. TaxID=1871183 RepID=UPI002D781C48|nr:hypothetical protein [Kribbella sp.]HET6297977.1 hypothetical protein [Kribbella sp.]